MLTILIYAGAGFVALAVVIAAVVYFRGKDDFDTVPQSVLTRLASTASRDGHSL
jgi:hypothetical protein